MAAPGLFGGDIVHRPQSLLGEGGLGGGHDPGDAEIGHLDAAVTEDHDVLGFNVPVDDPPAVGVSQGPDDLGDEVQGLPPIQAALLFLHVLLEGDPVDELHDDIIQVVPLAHVVDGDDVGVGEHGHGLGLLVEAAAKLRVSRQVPLEDLDGHKAVEAMAVGLVHHRHAAHPDDVQDFITIVEYFTDVLVHGNTLLLTAGRGPR